MKEAELKPPYHSFLPGFNFIPDSSASSLVPNGARRMGNRGCPQFITVPLGCSFLLMFLPCSSIRSFPQPTALNALLQRRSFPQLLLFTNYSSTCLFHRTQSFRKRLLHRPTVPARKPAPAWALHGLSLPSGHLHLLQCGVSPWAVVWISVLMWSSTRRFYLLHQGPLCGLQGNLWSTAWSTPSPLFLL